MIDPHGPPPAVVATDAAEVAEDALRRGQEEIVFTGFRNQENVGYTSVNDLLLAPCPKSENPTTLWPPPLAVEEAEQLWRGGGGGETWDCCVKLIKCDIFPCSKHLLLSENPCL